MTSFLEAVKVLATPIIKLCELVHRKGEGGDEWRKRQLQELYGPLQAVLLDSHITKVKGVSYPSLRQRIRRAWKYKKWRLLRDRGISEGAEVEFGRPLPLDEIDHIVKQHPELADSKLLGLLHSAERAQYEYGPKRYPYDLRSQETELIDHIYEKYRELAERYLA